MCCSTALFFFANFISCTTKYWSKFQVRNVWVMPFIRYWRMLRNTYTYTQLIDMNSHEPLFNLASNKKANISELHQHRSTPKPCTAYALHCLSLVLYVYCIIGPMKCMVLKYERKEWITELQLYNKTWQLFSSTSTNMATVPCESTVHYNIYTLLRACCLACLCISARRQCYQYPQLWTVYNENVHMSSQKQQINQPNNGSTATASTGCADDQNCCASTPYSGTTIKNYAHNMYIQDL